MENANLWSLAPKSFFGSINVPPTNHPKMIYHGTVFLCISYILKQLLFSHSVVSGSLRRHGLQQDRLPNPSSFPVVRSNS